MHQHLALAVGEGPGGWVVSVSPEAAEALQRELAGKGALALGSVGGNQLVAAASAASLDIPVTELRDAYEAGIANRLR